MRYSISSLRSTLLFHIGRTVACSVFPAFAWAQAPATLTGDWVGTLGPLTLTVHLTDLPTGSRTATLDIPAQNAQALPLQFTWASDSVYLRLRQPVAYFAGRRSAGGQQLVGEWRQAGKAFPLTLQRSVPGTRSGPARPQTPRAPFPYTATEVLFRNRSASVDLAGTLTLPLGPGPFPAVVLLTGSGPEDRNETVFGHQPFWVLADYLTRRGIAVLRFDDRGVGKSGGSPSTSTSATYATDAQAALAFVRSHPHIAQDHVGLLGHSEGGTAALLAAGQPQGPNFLVLLAAPGLPGDELIVQQVLALNKLQGADPAQLLAIEERQREVLRIVLQTPDKQVAQTKLRPLLNPNQSTDPAQLARVEAQLQQLLSPAYGQLLSDRPAQTLPRVQCPVLALTGSQDRQVIAKPNLAAIQQGLQAAGNPAVTARELPGLNHLFQTAPTGSPAEYSTLEETFAPSAMQLISDWIAAQVKR